MLISNNYIGIYATKQGEKMKKVLVFICGLLIFTAAAKEYEIDYKSSFDNSDQKAYVVAPEELGSEPMPLLVYVHFMGGDRYTACKLNFHTTAKKKGFYLISPELHGKHGDGKTSCAAIEAQHDVLDAIGYMKKKYNIDNSRIYIAGRSMGGMLTQIMLAKHPDIFAAGMAGQSCSDLSRPEEFSLPVWQAIENETKGDAFELSRRSSVNFARNFAYVPLLMWHGTADGLVSVKQSDRLYHLAKQYNPYMKEIFYLPSASHIEQNVNSDWVWDQLSVYRSASDMPGIWGRWFPELDFVSDESGRVFYLEYELADNSDFAEIQSKIEAVNGKFDRSPAMSGANRNSEVPVKMSIKLKNVKALTVDIKQIPSQLMPDEYLIYIGSVKVDDFSFNCSENSAGQSKKSPKVTIISGVEQQ